MSARFLYSWPDVPRYHSILQHKAVDHEGAQGRLRRIYSAAGPVDHPLVLSLVPDAMSLLDTFLEELHAEAKNQEGLEAGFLGKGRGTVVRLAGILSLLRWSEAEGGSSIPEICRDDMNDAEGLWSDYFRPHALAAIYRPAETARTGMPAWSCDTLGTLPDGMAWILRRAGATSVPQNPALGSAHWQSILDDPATLDRLYQAFRTRAPRGLF